MRKRTRLLAASALVLGLACGGDEQQPSTPPGQAGEAPVPADSLPMPAFPEPRRGHLVARGAGAYNLSGEWPARAGMCEEPGVMEVLAQQPGVGTIVLLRLPPQAQRLTTYPITIVDSGTPAAPAAQMGVQLFQGANAYAFQGLDGQVLLTGLSDRVSGRYQVTLREINSDDLAKYSGVFESVVLEPLPEGQCEEWRRQLLPADSAQGDE